MPSGVYERTKYHKKRLSEGQKEFQANLTKEEKKERMKIFHAAATKARQTLEVRQKMSESGKKVWAVKSKKERTKRSKNWADAGHEANQKRWDQMNEEKRLKSMLPPIIANQKRRAQMTKEERREEARPWTLAGIKAAQKVNPSSIEKLIWKELDILNIKYETQVPLANGRFIVDIYISIWGLIIECNGTYWHNYKIFPKRKIRDDALEEYANKNNFRIVWLWEHDIRKDPRLALLNGLKRAKEMIIS